MLSDADYFDQFEEQPIEEEDYQPHVVNDPNIWGLYDVARGRFPDVPTTIYLVSGDNASGVLGLLFPDGTFMCKKTSRWGQDVVLQDGGADDGQELPKGRILRNPGTHGVNAFRPTSFSMEVVWDGSTKSPDIEIEGRMTGEHSRGLILGDYSRKGPQTTRVGRSPGAGAEADEGIHEGAHEFPTWRGTNNSFGLGAAA